MAGKLLSPSLRTDALACSDVAPGTSSALLHRNLLATPFRGNSFDFSSTPTYFVLEGWLTAY